MLPLPLPQYNHINQYYFELARNHTNYVTFTNIYYN